MSFTNGTPNGELYIGSVKWSSDFKHVVLFTNAQGVRSETARNTAILKLLKKQPNAIIKVTSPNGYIDVDGTVADIEKANYIVYKNDSEISNTYYFCFIKSFEIKSEKTTRLYIAWDYWQQFIYGTDIYQSYIERAIIPKSQDSAKFNTLPEPISATLEDEHLVKAALTGADWEPAWMLHAASIYDRNDESYHYEGIGSDNTFGEYVRPIPSASLMREILKQYGRKSAEDLLKDAGGDSGGTPTWKDWIKVLFGAGGVVAEAAQNIIATTSIADLEDHRTELIGLYAIPTWLNHASAGNTYKTNRRYSVSVSIPLNASSLANGYTPRNKKMLSSVCRAYILSNRNNLKITFKPELFTDASTTLTLYGIPTSTAGYQYAFSNYSDYQNSYGEVAYTSERRVGYDANTGINKAINAVGAGAQAIGAAGAIAGGIATANPVTALSGAGSVLSSGIRAIDSLGQIEEHFGNNGDLLRITGGRAQLLFYEINPLYNECVAIDNFFDMYGYSIHKHQTPNLYARSEWNYIKTADFNCYVKGGADAENAIKSIFNSGVTIWMKYEHFGDYSRTNN